MKNLLVRGTVSALLLLLPITLFMPQGLLALPSATYFGPFQATQTTVSYTTTVYTTTTVTLPSTNTTTTATVPEIVKSTIVIPATTTTIYTTTTTTVTRPSQPYAAKITNTTMIPSPGNVGQGSRVIFTITVRNTGTNVLSMAKVQLNIYMPSGILAASQYVIISNFVAGTGRTVQIVYTLSSSAPLGAWTYGVYVYRVYVTTTLLDQVTGQSFTVQSSTVSGRIVSASESPYQVARGGIATFTVTINNTGNVVWSGAKIAIMIYTPGGALYTMLTLTVASNVLPGVKYTCNTSWAVPYYVTTGLYSYGVYLYYGTSLVDKDVANTNTMKVI
jgi:hypothetical protein